ncbi:glycosyltransferase family 2 protein [Helicobacter cetorum]|uniref:Glycosyl transferase family protein n=1 Tax=Helicobacter cetorum (strain ATCC BAA-429 / MIT 00-7128) TaxID=182217 RepID=I0EPZ7_HELC0|nr:glycosyltransferase family 2 protein [Helicobacter cetorum]AFI05016.1 glycosyl transferase family protein [Helicobacter cetorum MIT 00-7128]
MSPLKVSIITASFNSEKTIRDTIESVLNQSYENIEYIIIDGKSTDNTLKIIQEYGNKITRIVSEPDRGIYDAMNKGIKLASGDIVALLNSDDFYTHSDVVEKIVHIFENQCCDSVYADLVFVNPNNLEKVVRYYESGEFKPKSLLYGVVPAHPTLFIKKEIYERYGLYKTDYKISADFEMIIRLFVKEQMSFAYLKEVIVKMRTGGASTNGLKSLILRNQENIRACKENGIQANWFSMLLKYPRKILGLFKRAK